MKRILSWTLVLCLLLGMGMLPQGAAADGAQGVAMAAGGLLHSLAIRKDDTLWAWGCNGDGQLGDGTDADKDKPVCVMTDAASVAAGDNHSLAIRQDGTLWAWGANSDGQIGDGTNADKNVPASVMTDVAAVAAGSDYTLAIQMDGTLWAWGSNADGQLGDGTNADKNAPASVMTNVASVAAGSHHTLAIKRDGTLWAWGDNDYGQLGDGTNTDRNAPVCVMTNVASVAAGNNHSLAIRRDGTLWAWGHNRYGQFGDGTNTGKNVPVRVMTDVASVAAGWYYTLAIQQDGALWAWGDNRYGQHGDGTVEDKNKPASVMTNVASVAAGSFHTLAIKRDGSLWACGYNLYGQIGDGTTGMRNAPVKIMNGSGPTVGITLSPSELTLTVGTTSMLTAQITPADAPDKTVKWSSGNPAVASVTQGGKVTALKAGSAVITAETSGGEKATCQITVKYAAYRALLIGNSDYQSGDDLPSRANVSAMENALRKSSIYGTRYSRIACKYDLKAGQIKKELKALKHWGISKYDVTLVYFSGHGTGIEKPDYKEKKAGIVGVDEKSVNVPAVKQVLDKIPGTIIVILESGFSGKFIGKGNAARAFNQAVIETFASGSAKGLEKGIKYHVITASAGDKLAGVGQLGDGDRASYMTYYVSAGIDSLAADADSDSHVTMAELFDYANPLVREKSPQAMQRYPENDDLVIAGRS